MVRTTTVTREKGLEKWAVYKDEGFEGQFRRVAQMKIYEK